jgi:hypothetical protein
VESVAQKFSSAEIAGLNAADRARHLFNDSTAIPVWCRSAS